MKILYAVQATGNGHLSRCIELTPYLKRNAEVDILVTGIQGDLNLPFEIQHKRHGISYIFGKRGGIDKWRTFIKLRPFSFIKDILTFNLKPYDFVVTDFEPVAAYRCKLTGKPCIAVSHQSAFLHPGIPRPKKKNLFGEFLFQYFAPAKHHIGVHYKRYSPDIFTPIVRQEIRDLKVTSSNHVLIYLPSFSSDQLIPHLRDLNQVDWVIFSKHTKERMKFGHIHVFPVGVPEWTEYLASASATIIGGGFTATAEMLHLGKKMMVIPMPDQYEQRCNAVALEEMGVRIVTKVDNSFPGHLASWLENDPAIHVDYENVSEEIVKRIMEIGEQAVNYRK